MEKKKILPETEREKLTEKRKQMHQMLFSQSSVDSAWTHDN